ncbi:MAG: hypothetical protein V1793_19645 [Pseudomonadota bacterium]
MNPIDTFIRDWEDNDSRTRKAFIEILNHLLSLDNTSLDFKERPGVSYSLRPRHANQKERTLFAMADVIDDDPDGRWLSVCFYGDMITDPDEAGDLVPQGLMGDDGHCFDLYEYDEQAVAYIKDRLTQAHQAAAEGSI